MNLDLDNNRKSNCCHGEMTLTKYSHYIYCNSCGRACNPIGDVGRAMIDLRSVYGKIVSKIKGIFK